MFQLYKSVFLRHFFQLCSSLWNINHNKPKNEQHSWYTIIRFSIPLILLFIIRPIGDLFWLLDELLFPGYHDTIVKDPVFVVSGPRTGSTSFHEACMTIGGEPCLEDHCIITSFTLDELFFPFLTWRYAFYYMQHLLHITGLLRFSKWLLEKIESIWVTNDIQAKHTISLIRYEENEFWFLWYHLLGLFVSHIVPTEHAASLTFDRLPIYEQDMIMIMFHECIQKHLYFQQKIHSNNIKLRFLSKCHGIHRISGMSKQYPDATIVTLIRDPKDSVPSYLSLRASATHMVTGLNLFSQKTVLNSQISEDIRYKQTELDLILGSYRSNSSEYMYKHPLLKHKHKWLVFYYSDFLHNAENVLGLLLTHMKCRLTNHGKNILHEISQKNNMYTTTHDTSSVFKQIEYKNFDDDFGPYYHHFFTNK